MDGVAEPADPDLADAADRIRERAATVRDEQVQRALAATDEDLSERERAEIRALADRIATRLVAAPIDELADLESADDEAVETALELFGTSETEAAEPSDLTDE